jgi:tetratricopeptide (TPR) repeat protein
VTATLPGALLVLLWWRRGRLSARRDVAPLVPWLAMSAAAGFMTAWMERTYIGARGSAFDLGILDRFLLAGRAAWFYAAKDAWPAGLLFVYPRWVVDSHAAWQYLFPLAVAVLVVFLFLLRGRSRGPLAATLLFLGTLFPALGFINVYPFVFSFVADHFQYLSCAGLLAFAAGGLASASESLGGRLGPAVRAASAAWVAVLGFLTWRQCHDYADVRTLYESVLRENPDCWLMHDNLGVVLVRDGKPGPAAEHFRQAMRLNPSYPEAFNNYGNLLARAGRLAEAEAAYAGALSARPGFAAAEYDWGFALSQSGRIEEAIPHFRNAIRMDAGYAEPHYELANALANLGRVDAAVTEYQAALRILPEFPEASANLGLAYASRGDWTRALPPLDTAVRLSPSYPQAHAFRGFALAGLGRYGEALDEYATAVKLGADTADVHVQMAAALDKLGRSTESRSELARARQIEASERDHGR